MTDIAEVTVVFSCEPGGPPVQAREVVEFVEAILSNGRLEGPNSLRYSRGRITNVAILGGGK